MRPRNQRQHVPEPLETAACVGGRRINRFQVVRERRDAGGGDDEWIVVGFADGEVRLADPGFERTRTVSAAAFRNGRFEPLIAGGVPVWGY